MKLHEIIILYRTYLRCFHEIQIHFTLSCAMILPHMHKSVVNQYVCVQCFWD